MDYITYCVCFFFQAEDGIRDVAVTGVQTCALPIFCANAGVDHSNVPGDDLVTLLPRDPDGSAEKLAAALRKITGDRKSVVKGKRVDLGGRRIIKKKKRHHMC